MAKDTTGDDEVALDDADELVVKDEADDGDEIVDEVGEVDKESFEEIQKFSESDRSSGNDANNADNELLHLTIDEDEEKIFQDRVSIWWKYPARNCFYKVALFSFFPRRPLMRRRMLPVSTIDCFY